MRDQTIKNLTIIMSCFILLFAISVGIINIASKTETKAEEAIAIQSEPNGDIEQAFCYFPTNDTYILGNNFGDINICVNTFYCINRINIIATNFTQLSFSIQSRNSIKVSLACFDNNIQEYYAEFECGLSDNTRFISKLFAINYQEGVFYSNFSIDEAKDRYETIIKGLYNCNDVKEDDADVVVSKYASITYEDAFALEKGLIQTRGNKDTYVSGSINWYDDNNNSHPLRNAKIQAYDANSVGGDTLLGTTNTNYYGNYSITFQNNDSIFDHYGSDVYIRVYASDGNILVKRQSSSAYTQDSDTYSDVATGSTTTINMSFSSGTDMAKAVQIFQAVEVGQYYAAAMIGSTPASVNVIYPYSDPNNPTGGCFYYSGTIYIVDRVASGANPASYASWDVITHEYGHHIEYIMDIINSPGGSHSFANVLAATRGSKSDGIRLAWSEAWATAFGIIAQREYPYSISSIPTADDLEYSSYNGAYINVETAIAEYSVSTRNGESCEGAIVGALWDLYDGTNETWDDIDLTASEWWDITTISGTYTFSAFVQNFYDEYLEYESELGKILEYYKMCASDFLWVWGSTTMLPPTISWSNDSGWTNHPFDYVLVLASNYSDTVHQIIALGATTGGTLTQEQWDSILAWHTSEIHIQIFVTHSGPPETGAYVSQTYTIDMPEFSTVLRNDGTLEITGSIGTLTGSISIPNSLCNNTAVTSIASYAFSRETGITSISIPSSITNIGAHAFDGCTALTTVSMSNASITAIVDYTFYNCPITSLSWPNNSVVSIGDYAFYGNALTTIVLTSSTTSIGTGAFGNANNLTIYDEGNRISTLTNWNSSNRPYVYDCTLSSNKLYVNSFSKTSVNPYPGYSGTINNIARSGYTFSAWYTTSDYSGTSYSNIAGAPNDVTLYAKYTSNSSGSCITTGSLITLADGTQTAVENLTGNEQLLVWDMLNGTFTSAPILFIDSEITATYDVITLTFSDGTQVDVIDEHAFFDTTLNKYVFLRSDAAQYIGHYFKKQSYDMNNNMMLVNVQLIDVSISQQVTMAYSPVTYGHLCYYVNGMLSMPGNTESFINIFDVDAQTMAYDQTSMAQDISTYGLYTYEEFSSIIPIPELVFNAFNGQYLKVAIGKGITTLQEIQNLLNRYMSFFE